MTIETKIAKNGSKRYYVRDDNGKLSQTTVYKAANAMFGKCEVVIINHDGTDYGKVFTGYAAVCGFICKSDYGYHFTFEDETSALVRISCNEITSDNFTVMEPAIVETANVEAEPQCTWVDPHNYETVGADHARNLYTVDATPALPKPDSPFAIANNLNDIFQNTVRGISYMDVTTQDGAKIATCFGAAYIAPDWRVMDGYVFANHYDDVLARYDTPEQVIDVMTALHDAIKAGKTQFIFPADFDERYYRGEKIAADLTKKLRPFDPTVEVTFGFDDDDGSDVYYLYYDGISGTPFTLDGLEESFRAFKRYDREMAVWVMNDSL